MRHSIKAATLLAAFFLVSCSSCTSEKDHRMEELTSLAALAESLQHAAHSLRVRCTDTLTTIGKEPCKDLPGISDAIEVQKETLKVLLATGNEMPQEALLIATADISYRLNTIETDLRYIESVSRVSIEEGR